MNYVHLMFCGGKCMRCFGSDEPVVLASLALLIGMIAIWAQVLAAV
jgi:hypothetical protein